MLVGPTFSPIRDGTLTVCLLPVRRYRFRTKPTALETVPRDGVMGSTGPWCVETAPKLLGHVGGKCDTQSPPSRRLSDLPRSVHQQGAMTGLLGANRIWHRQPSLAPSCACPGPACISITRHRRWKRYLEEGRSNAGMGGCDSPIWIKVRVRWYFWAGLEREPNGVRG
jgi:hypothetical protein